MNGDEPPVVVSFPDGERLADTCEAMLSSSCHAYAVPVEPEIPAGRTTPATLFIEGAAAATFFDSRRGDAVAALLDSAHILYVMGSLSPAQRAVLKPRLEAVGYPV